MSLVELLQTVPEFRHLRGKRHQLWLILLLMIVGAMCGYWGYRPLAEFSQLYGSQVCQHLNYPLPRRLPSHSTFRRVILELDFQAFAQVFNQWVQQYVSIEPGEWLAVDGKSIKGSVSDYDNEQQNFVMLVSVFSPSAALSCTANRWRTKPSVSCMWCSSCWVSSICQERW